MNDFTHNLRFALRQFRKSPGFVATAVLSLALGIGATTAVFSVIYGVLLDPYPYKDNDRMVHVELLDKSGNIRLLRVSGSGYQLLRQTSSVDDVFLQQNGTQNLTGAEIPVGVNVGTYSPNLFEYMGVPSVIGREFTSADAPNGNAAPVAVLSYLFWQRQFGGSRDVVGKTLELDHKAYQILGVVPPRFTWGDCDVYLPGSLTADPHDYWLAFVKLKPRTPYAKAQAEFQALADSFARIDKGYAQECLVKVVSLNEQVLGKFAGTLVLLFGAVIALLVIGCANVSILLLSRGAARQHELAVRVSVGAGRGRLIRQLLTESVLLSVTGAALGVLAAYKGVAALAAALPFYSFPHEAAIHVNALVLIFSAAVALITGILFGISPAWKLSRPQLGNLIQASSAKHTGSGHSRNVHRLLIAGQVALTILLLAAAGAAMKAFVARTHTQLGFEPDHVFFINVGFPKGSNPTWQGRLNAHELVRKTIVQVPGVESASISNSWFPPFGGFSGKVEVQGKPALSDAQAVLALSSPYEFLTLRIPLIEGRVFDDGEVMRAAHVALVNQAFVKQFLSDGDPIGRSVRSPMLKVEQPNLVSAQAPDDWLQIIGVVGDAKDAGLDKPVQPAVFLPYSFVLTPDTSLFIRATASPELVAHSIKERLRQINPEMVVSRDRTLTWWLETQGWGRERFIATLFSLFAVLALVLAATGLYSVVAYVVTQRTQEVGIRMALGAPRSSIVGLVLSSTGAMLGIGIVTGVVLSLLLDRVLMSWAGGSSRDPLTLLASAAVLVLVAVVACTVPSWRAATIDPMNALRVE
jgi:predicted permease